AAFWHAISIADAKRWLEAALEKGDVSLVALEDTATRKGRRVFAPSDWEKRLARFPDPPDRMRLLSPFDPILRDRKRTERLFGFEYRLEVYVPEPKRVYGYYVMPILDRDRLIGRIDLKHERKPGTLFVQGLWWEPGVRDSRRLRSRLDDALVRLRDQIG